MMKAKSTYTTAMKWILGLCVMGMTSTLISWTSTDLDTVFHAVDKEKIYEQVDEMPRFTGCEAEKMKRKEREECAFGKLIEYMTSEVKYPKVAEKDGVEGTVFVQYIVDRNGKILGATVEQSVHEALDAEALRVVNSMPDWVPGVHQGNKVSVSMVLPVKFALAPSIKK